MHRVIRADVPIPLWDEHRCIVVMPRQLTDREAGAAMVELVRERSPRAVLQETAER